MFSAIAFLQEQRVLAEKWTSPRPARERLPGREDRLARTFRGPVAGPCSVIPAQAGI